MILYFLTFIFGCSAVDVNGMLELDIISSTGFKNKALLQSQLMKVKQAGFTGVMGDVWWGLVETSPKNYNFKYYLELVEMIKNVGLKYQPVMSFHKCGGNVGDTCNIPIPKWAIDAVKKLDGFFKDSHGNVNDEYINFALDNVAVEGGRTPIDFYYDFMNAFSTEFKSYISDGVIDEIQIGVGPSGEIRYPSYCAANGWQYPGIGEFQVSDSNSLSLLQRAAEAKSHSEWAHIPTDAGVYNSKPSDTNFFDDNKPNNYASDYGKFFLEFYTQLMLNHTDRVIIAARKAFGTSLPLAAKVSGVHWWYGSSSHAAEATAGYYQVNGYSTYSQINDILGKHGARFTFTCLEMANPTDLKADPKSRPEDLVTEVFGVVTKCDKRGENALDMMGNSNEFWFDEGALSRTINQVASKKLNGFTFLRLHESVLSSSKLYQKLQDFVSQLNSI
ncbi:hypothetical protein ENUP19_0265G0042 [Entamoeba nuttalli]|uniref:Beta-amylase n=2 Tax=Entamoeba nuttalli TaxID=412467 RepID=K2HPB0_ENTNP|nr:beta-amylase, putative [Entamoeba nuttalli P19]EKE37685.1 beta-amylase, putative [Entamoeba nuttalli P19]|eukprot:XP_008859972.1 beta-amylase, putative [Entamoeba nuttalli P19]